MLKVIRTAVLSGVLGLMATGAALAADSGDLKPFILAYKTTGDLQAVANDVRGKVEAAGFQVAGSYSPYSDAVIMAVTNDQLKQAAASTEFGGYAAAQRVTVTKVGDQIQVAYTNPVYMGNAYRLTDNADAKMQAVESELAKALGKEEQYGPSEGLTPNKLRKYHYMFGMEYFTDPSQLAEYDNYDQAVKAVETGLAAGKGDTAKVYRIDIPGKQETVFGVALKGTGCDSDQHIMKEIDFKPLRSTGHLPYEILVSGGDVYALYARFRIAINFPDLKMMGKNSFVNIMCAPNAIEKALTEAAGGKV